jgi:hypothetical protein
LQFLFCGWNGELLHFLCWLNLDQEWPTQIGLWAEYGKNSKNIDFLGQISEKL